MNILFITGTRADYGKLKPLIFHTIKNNFKVKIFCTGMHMLKNYGLTYREIEKDLENYQISNDHLFKAYNQYNESMMESAFINTVQQLSHFLDNNTFDLLLVHGDRIEAIAAAVVGALRNIRVAHVEGGERSGTVDDLIRHSVSKLAKYHLVADETAKSFLISHGENKENIFPIGSPDHLAMSDDLLPSLTESLAHYEINTNNYGLVLFHSVTTDDSTTKEVKELVDALLKSKKNYILIDPNNDHGREEIVREYKRLDGCNRIFRFPSIRFEYFITILKNSSILIGNSSAGIRETPIFGVPTINIGSRQNKRARPKNVINLNEPHSSEILKCIEEIWGNFHEPEDVFGSNKFDTLKCFDQFLNFVKNDNLTILKD